MLCIDDTKYNADVIRVDKNDDACSSVTAISHDNIAHLNVAMDYEKVVEIEGEDLSKLGKSENLVQYPTSSSEDVGVPTLTLLYLKRFINSA